MVELISQFEIFGMLISFEHLENMAVILEILFNFYKKLKKVINYEQSKELLQDIIDIMTVDDFKIKVDKVEKRIIQIIEDIQIKKEHFFIKKMDIK